MTPAATRSAAVPHSTRPPPMAVTARERFGGKSARWAFVILIVAGFVGDITMPLTVERFPLLLILLSPRWRMMVLVSRQLDAGLLFSFGLARRLLTILVLYRAGSHGIARGQRFGPPSRPSRGRFQRFQGGSKRSSAVLLAVFPGPPAAFLAGVESLPLARVVALATVGTLSRLLVLTRLGGALHAPLDLAIGFIGAHHLQFTGLILAYVVFRTLRLRIGGRALRKECKVLRLRPLVAPDGHGGLPVELKEATEVVADEHPLHRGDRHAEPGGDAVGADLGS